MKICIKCGLETPLDNFRNIAKNKDGKSSTCKQCMTKKDKEYYKNYKPKKNAAVTKRRNKIKTFLTHYKSTLKCAVCLEDSPECLDFHHENPENKDFSIGDALRIGYSQTRIEAELAKCVVLCSNCHRKYHAGTLTKEQLIYAGLV